MPKEKLHIIKIGGNVINNEAVLNRFIKAFATVKERKILVHGGGRLLDVLAKKLEIPQQMINGRRITNAETLELATMVYAGTINRTIVSQLQAAGVNALGLSGADLNCIKAEKRTGAAYDFGLVGDIKPGGVNSKALSLLLENSMVPVFCSITHDGHGQLLNTNADSLSSAIATCLSSMYDVQLNYCFEKKGVLLDAQNDASLIPRITSQAYKQLLNDNIVTEGMIPKLDMAFAAIEQGVDTVVIGHADELTNIISKQEHAGTYLVA